METIDRDSSINKEKFLAKGGLGKADVYIARLRGRPYVVKDFSSKGFLERNLIGRLLISREARAYKALAGVSGVPERFERLSPFTLAVEYIDAKDLGAVKSGDIGPDVIRRLEDIIERIHRRGWVHLDLQRRTNILLVNGEVVVIDLASAFNPGSIPVIGRLLTRLLGFFDRLSLVKLKKLYAPDSLTDMEKRLIRLRNLVMPRKW